MFGKSRDTRSTPLLRRSISLKWKALGLTSLVLLALVGGLTWLAHQQLKSQFDEQQTLLDKTRYEALAGLVDRTKSSLLGLASVAKSFEGVEASLIAGDVSRLYREFKLHYSELAIALGLREARFYAQDNELLASFGERRESPESEEQVANWVREANEKEIPIATLSCSESCEFFGVTPLMVNGRHYGTALFALPLGEMVASFHYVTKAHIALLTAGSADTDDASVEPYLSTWGLQVQALTNRATLYPVLDEVSRRFPIASLGSGVIESIGDAHYRLTAVPLNRFAEDGEGYWVFISDVSRALAAIQASLRTNLLYGFAGLIVAEVLLALLLWKPLSRLRSTAETLPLLGQGAFQQARDAIADRRSVETTLFSDESDMLDQTAIALSERLEMLESRERSRTTMLRSQAYQLRRERDFIQRLLDNAQAIILTQDKDLTIRSLNAFGESILGGPDQIGVQLRETRFTDLMTSPEDSGEVQRALRKLVEGRIDTHQHDATVQDKNHATRSVAWRHSRLDDETGDFSVLSIGLDVSEQRDAERRISWLADHDPLTELFNRRRFQEELQRAIAEALRFHQSGALLYLDLDQFKYINDASGHAVGDSLLKTVALTLIRTVRSTDIVSRLGGDEFAVLLPQTNEQGAIELAKKIQSALTFLQVDANERAQRVTASIGIALYPEHGANIHDLLATADLAMYQAKAGGRDRWRLYSPESRGRDFIRSELQMKTIVEEAIAGDRLVFHYQPIFDLEAGTISHIEALLRIRLQDGRFLMPGEFVGVAERTGIIREIDRIVLKKAIKDIAQFVGSGHDVRLSVNQSAFAFDDPHFLSTIKEMLKAHPIEPERLMLEITESAAVTNFMSTCEVLNELKQAGCLVAIDDFGTGFSSLRYVKQLPVDFIKIDGVFVKDIVDKQDDQILIQAVIEVARMFGKKTIAEYVERKEVFDWLSAHGTDYAQGYFIGHAMARAEIVALLEDSTKLSRRLITPTRA